MTGKFRNAFFWAHLIVGVVAGLFILNMAGSGILIAYQKQITALMERKQRTISMPADATQMPLGIEILIAKVQEARPEVKLTGMVVSSDPSMAVLFNVGRENQVLYVNPYTGEMTGEGNSSVRGFFQFVNSWHRWLALEGEHRSIGKAITGAVSLAYFALLCSGLYLWLPKQWSANRVKQGALFNPKLQGKARNWNWHNVIGLWCAPLLLLVTLTGIIMSYDWAENLLFRLGGSSVAEHRGEGGDHRGNREGGNSKAKVDFSGIDLLWIQAEKQVSDWRSISCRFPSSSSAPVVFQINRDNGERPDRAARLTLDRATGDIVRWQPYGAQKEGQKLRSWVRPIHTGEAGGMLGQSIACLAAFGSILLVWTGFSMAWHRFNRFSLLKNRFPSST